MSSRFCVVLTAAVATALLLVSFFAPTLARVLTDPVYNDGASELARRADSLPYLVQPLRVNLTINGNQVEKEGTLTISTSLSIRAYASG